MNERLSSVARAWLAARGVSRRRPAHSQEVTRRCLEERGAAAWPAVLAVEACFGGLRGIDPVDERELWFGVDDVGAFGAQTTLDGEVHVLVAAYGPIGWYMSELGRIVEVDDLRERFYESDSIDHRIEQLARFDVGSKVERLEGAHGERIAAALGLREIAKASDARQRYWQTPGDDLASTELLLVRESLEPVDYGRRELVRLTWISANTQTRIAEARAIPTS